MKKIFLKILIAVLMEFALVNFNSCSNERALLSSNKEIEPISLNIYLMGKVENIDGMLAKFYSITHETLNVHLNIYGIEKDFYPQTLSAALQSAQNVDLCFDSTNMDMRKRVDDGVYLELQQYLKSDLYYGLKKAFSYDYLKANRINGKNYGLPIMSSFLNPTGITYRKDLIQKYKLNFNTISNYEELDQYFKKLKENDITLIPLSIDLQNGFFSMFSNDIDFMKNNIYDIENWPSYKFPVKVVLSEDQKTVKDVVFATDIDERFKSLGGNYNYNFFKEQYEKYVYWSKYTAEYSIVAKPSYLLQAAELNQLGNSSAYQQKLHEVGCDEAEVDFLPADSLFSSNIFMMQHSIPTNMKATNFLCIPRNSQNITITLQFLDWLFSKQDNIDLFKYGVEGEDWKAVGENEYELINKENPYTFPSECMALNPNYIRIPITFTENEKRIANYINNPESYTLAPLAGWEFNPSPVVSQIAQLEAAYEKYRLLLMHGKPPYDIQKILEEMRIDFDSCEIEKVRDQIIWQAQYYLDYQISLN
jgi:putative aldouronate transport system substrate-binding protein